MCLAVFDLQTIFTVITGIATSAYAISFGYDIWLRNRKISVKSVEVPNTNGGHDGWRVIDRRGQQGNAKKIEIMADGSVRITHLTGQVVCYRTYRNWVGFVPSE